MQKKNLLFSTVKIYYTNYRSIVRYSDSWKHQIKNDLSKPLYCQQRMYYSSDDDDDRSLIETSSSSMVSNFYDYWDYLQSITESIQYKVRNPGHLYVYTKYIENPSLSNTEIIILSFIKMLELYAYKMKSKYVKVTLGYKLLFKIPNNYEIAYTLGVAIPLFDLSGAEIQRRLVYDKIERQVRKHAEDYETAVVIGVFMNIYSEKNPDQSTSIIDFPDISIDRLKEHILIAIKSETLSIDYPQAKSLITKPARIPNHITALKGSRKETRPFIVADIETVMVDNVQVPYAAGYVSVNPGDDISTFPSHSIKIFFSEDHITVYSDFQVRSESMFHQFCSNMESCVHKSGGKVRTIYFHNLGSFDGFFIMKYYVSQGEKYHIKPLIRNSKVLELKVYLDGKFLFRFRDSYLLLPGSLESLGATLCPELGSKGSIPHATLDVSQLAPMRSNLLDYLRQDIILTAGVMLKSQHININKYQIDVEDVMTLPSLSLKIFRKNYFNEKAFNIAIPNRNQDTFIRRAYYGGHVDVYKPYGENLFYYDVNSLYPYIMKTYPMPSGPPVWKNHLYGLDLDSLYGFIEAYVVCPASIERPFLPFKDKFGTLIFPTGKFTGVYYTEELKYAKTLGYEIIPLRGYIFDCKPSPFKGIIEDLYQSRLEAKKKGDDAMSFIYKILMNSLYGRFGINPESTVTEICKEDRYNELMKMDSFESCDPINENYYLVKYKSNSSEDDDWNWKPPKMSAVHLAAAITACARIHMYPHVSLSDCYYTDTDSIVLGSPLNDSLISSKEMGLYKLEFKVKQGIFMAPKSYMLKCEGDTTIIKHKGIAKAEVTAEWFESIYSDPTLVKEMTQENPFGKDWKNLRIVNKSINLRLGIPKSTKRKNVYDENKVWVNTRPREVINVGSEDHNIIIRYEQDKGFSASQSTTEDGKTTTEDGKTTTEDGKTTTEEGKTTTEEGKKTYTQESTLYTPKPNKNTIQKFKGKAKSKKDNSSPGRPKPDE